VKGCAHCSGRLDAFTAARRSSAAAPGYRHTLAALQQPPRRTPFWRRWQIALPLAASLAAAGAFLLAPRATDRIKGAPSLELVREGTGEVVAGPVRPGDKLALAVGAAGARQLLVMAVGDDGSIAKLWPVGRQASGPAREGAAARLSPPFVVTPGSATLFAFFFASPVASAPVEQALRDAVAAAAKRDQPPAMASPAPLDREQGRATFRLCVEGSPCSQPR
jgi:hypothetical protein